MNVERGHVGTRYVVLISSVAALGGLLFGYDTAVISGAKLIMPLDTSTLSIKDQALIEREFTVMTGFSVSD